MAFYKRSTFLTDARFQLKFSLIVCSLIFLSSLLYPYFLLDYFEVFTKPGHELASNVATARNKLITFLIIIQIIFVLIVFIFMIFLTHKIAGPMYKLKTHLSDIRQGAEITPLSFRDGDYLHDVAEEVSLFLESIKLNQEKDFEYLDEVSLYIENIAPALPDDKKPILNEISRRLLQIKTRYI